MSTKTSTAALELFRRGMLRTPRRVPRHPAGAIGVAAGLQTGKRNRRNW